MKHEFELDFDHLTVFWQCGDRRIDLGEDEEPRASLGDLAAFVRDLYDWGFYGELTRDDFLMQIEKKKMEAIQ